MNKDDKNIYISVYLQNQGWTPAGVIVFNTLHGYAGFSYFSSYIENNYPPLNPATLNWRDGNQRFFVINPQQNKHMLDRTFWELIPGQNDWGNKVLISRYPEYANMNYAEKLYFLGNKIVGGLSSYVKEKNIEESVTSLDWLDSIREESVDFYKHDIEKISHIGAINPLTSYGGARPKCMYQDENGDYWIAKFNLPNDPYNMAVAEHTALDISRDIGLNTSESKVLTLPSGNDVFLSKRFDRQGENRYHSLSLFSLSPGNQMFKNENIQGNPASFIQTLIRRYSDFETKDALNIVVKMLLDIGINNTDNHLRNLRIILNQRNKWELSPIYDLVFNPENHNHVYNPAGVALNELYLNNPKLAEYMSKELGIKQDIILGKIEHAKKVISNWEFYCDNNHMSDKDKLKIRNAISLGLNRKNAEYELKVQKTINHVPKLKLTK